MKRENGTRVADWFFTVLLLLSIGGIVLRSWDLRQRADTERESFSVTGRCESMDARSADCVREGDWLYTVSGERFGRIERISLSPATMRIESKGILYESKMPEETRVELTLTVSVFGRERGGVLQRDGLRPVSVGERVTLRSELAEMRMTVQLWERVGGEES